MNMQEFMDMPKGMDVQRYEYWLKERDRIRRMMYRLSGEIQAEEDALEVLADEKGSPRYISHMKKLMKHLERQYSNQKMLELCETNLKNPDFREGK